MTMVMECDNQGNENNDKNKNKKTKQQLYAY